MTDLEKSSPVSPTLQSRYGDGARTFFGAALLLGSVFGFEWGARVAGYETGSSVLGNHAVGGLVLAYGLGLTPMVVALLLFEAAGNLRYRWVVLAGAIPALYVLLRWTAHTRDFYIAHEKAFLPSALLVVGIFGVLGWTASLWIRLRRRTIETDLGGSTLTHAEDTESGEP